MAAALTADAKRPPLLKMHGYDRWPCSTSTSNLRNRHAILGRDESYRSHSALLKKSSRSQASVSPFEPTCDEDALSASLTVRHRSRERSEVYRPEARGGVRFGVKLECHLHLSVGGMASRVMVAVSERASSLAVMLLMLYAMLVLGSLPGGSATFMCHEKSEDTLSEASSSGCLLSKSLRVTGRALSSSSSQSVRRTVIPACEALTSAMSAKNSSIARLSPNAVRFPPHLTY
jgi:hypothetical protein